MLKTRIVNLQSKLLGKEVSYYAILPENHSKQSAAGGVLYLLHGLFGRFDNYLTNTKIAEYAKDLPFLIICPEGGDNWYSDNTEIADHYYESYFFEELIPEVERKFNAGKNRNSRAVAGLSMGGYGAFKFAFCRPEMFCFAASMSGAFHAAAVFEDEPNPAWQDLVPSILSTFGKKGDKSREANDLFRMAENFPAEQIENLPFFYFDCGAEDSFLPVNQRFAQSLKRRQIIHQFLEISGAHDWDYWDRRLKVVLSLVKDQFSK